MWVMLSKMSIIHVISQWYSPGRPELGESCTFSNHLQWLLVFLTDKTTQCPAHFSMIVQCIVRIHSENCAHSSFKLASTAPKKEHHITVFSVGCYIAISKCIIGFPCSNANLPVTTHLSISMCIQICIK